MISMISRLLISIGLMFGGLFLSSYAIFPAIHDVKTMEVQIFSTTCSYLYGEEAEQKLCDFIRNCITAGFIAASLTFLIFGPGPRVGFISAAVLLAFLIYYTNPLIDKSFINSIHAIEIGMCALGIVCLGYKAQKNIKFRYRN